MAPLSGVPNPPRSVPVPRGLPWRRGHLDRVHLQPPKAPSPPLRAASPQAASTPKNRSQAHPHPLRNTPRAPETPTRATGPATDPPDPHLKDPPHPQGPPPSRNPLLRPPPLRNSLPQELPPQRPLPFRDPLPHRPLPAGTPSLSALRQGAPLSRHERAPRTRHGRSPAPRSRAQLPSLWQRRQSERGVGSPSPRPSILRCGGRSYLGHAPWVGGYVQGIGGAWRATPRRSPKAHAPILGGGVGDHTLHLHVTGVVRVAHA